MPGPRRKPVPSRTCCWPALPRMARASTCPSALPALDAEIAALRCAAAPTRSWRRGSIGAVCRRHVRHGRAAPALTATGHAGFRHAGGRRRWSSSTSGRGCWSCFTGPTLAFADLALQPAGAACSTRRWRGAASMSRSSARLRATPARPPSPLVATGRRSTASSLYPQGRISEVQRRQMTTVDAGNAHAHRDRRHVRRLPGHRKGAVRRHCLAPRPQPVGGELDQLRADREAQVVYYVAAGSWRSARRIVRCRSRCRPAISAMSMRRIWRARWACRLSASCWRQTRTTSSRAIWRAATCRSPRSIRASARSTTFRCWRAYLELLLRSRAGRGPQRRRRGPGHRRLPPRRRAAARRPGLAGRRQHPHGSSGRRGGHARRDRRHRQGEPEC